jgi:hypothetical protein
MPDPFGTIVSSVIGADSSRSAANTQADAQLTAAQMQQNQFNTQWNSPMNQALQGQGPNALNALMDRYGNHQFNMNDFTNSAAYQSMLGPMNQGTSAQAAASGMLGSGNMQSALQQNALASEQTAFNQYYQPAGILQSVAGLSQNQNLGMASLGQSNAYNMGQNMIGAGNAQAAGIIGQGNAWSNMGSRMGSGAMSGFQQGMNYYNNQNALYNEQQYGNQQADYWTQQSQGTPFVADDFYAG